MKKIAFLALAAALCGCALPGTKTEDYVPIGPDTPDPWNTNYLIGLDPETVTTADLTSHAAAAESQYWTYGQVNGVLWPPYRTDASLEHPDRWVDGGDSCIFTGHGLACWSFKFATTKDPADLDKVEETLKGLWILVNATGTPGAICRNAAPFEDGALFGYPDEVQHRIEKGFVGHGPELVDPFTGDTIPGGGFWYYTRATKDQLTGVALGLSAISALTNPADYDPSLSERLEKVRQVASSVATSTYDHLVKHRWKIRDQKGENDTTADYVDGLLRSTFLSALDSLSSGFYHEEAEAQFAKAMSEQEVLSLVDVFANYDAYYGHNLRSSRLLGLWLVYRGDPEKEQELKDYVQENVWRYTSTHRNAWFCFVRNVIHHPDVDSVENGLRGLKGMVLKPFRGWSSPYAGQEVKPRLIDVLFNDTEAWVLDTHLRKFGGYWTWQKEPWDVESHPFPTTSGYDEEGLNEATGLDFLAAYWLGKLYSLF